MLSAPKRLIVGQPLASAQARHERLSKSTGLAIFASDNLSSVAYASEEILSVLLLAGVTLVPTEFIPARGWQQLLTTRRRC